MEAFLLWEGSYTEPEEEYEESTLKKETATETMCEELMPIPILNSSALLGGGRESRIKLSLGESGGWGEGVLKI